jgi:hypothetical protein
MLQTYLIPKHDTSLYPLLHLISWEWTSPYEIYVILVYSLLVSPYFLQPIFTHSKALSPQANYTNCATATCRRNLVSTFVDRGVSRGQRGGSPTIVTSTLFNFLRLDIWNLWNLCLYNDSNVNWVVLVRSSIYFRVWQEGTDCLMRVPVPGLSFCQ